jgi:hypothetical protein
LRVRAVNRFSLRTWTFHSSGQVCSLNALCHDGSPGHVEESHMQGAPVWAQHTHNGQGGAAVRASTCSNHQVPLCSQSPCFVATQECMWRYSRMRARLHRAGLTVATCGPARPPQSPLWQALPSCAHIIARPIFGVTHHRQATAHQPPTSTCPCMGSMLVRSSVGTLSASPCASVLASAGWPSCVLVPSKEPKAHPSSTQLCKFELRP